MEKFKNIKYILVFVSFGFINCNDQACPSNSGAGLSLFGPPRDYEKGFCTSLELKNLLFKEWHKVDEDYYRLGKRITSFPLGIGICTAYCSQYPKYNYGILLDFERSRSIPYTDVDGKVFYADPSCKETPDKPYRIECECDKK